MHNKSPRCRLYLTCGLRGDSCCVGMHAVAIIVAATGVVALLLLLATLCVLFARRQQQHKHSSSKQIALMSISGTTSKSHSSLDTIDMEMNKSHEAVVLGQGTFGKVCNCLCHLTILCLFIKPCITPLSGSYSLAQPQSLLQHRRICA